MAHVGVSGYAFVTGEVRSARQILGDLNGEDNRLFDSIGRNRVQREHRERQVVMDLIDEPAVRPSVYT